MNEQKNGVSVLDTNQSAASWNVVHQSSGKIYVNDQFIFQDYVINTLLSMGFPRSLIDKILPELDIETKNEIQVIEQAICLLTLETAPDVLTEEEEKEAIIRQKELHLFSKPNLSQIINNNPDLREILDTNSDKSESKIECIICMENVSKEKIWKNVCKHYDIVCLS